MSEAGRIRPAASLGLALCRRCERLNEAERSVCRACGGPLGERPQRRIQQTLALLTLAVLLYFPANVWPILRVSRFGMEETNTILGGVATLWGDGSIGIAVIIFFASVFVPLAKIAALAWLCLQTTCWPGRQARHMSLLYRAVEFVGRWSMMDVFVVATLAGLVRFGRLFSVEAGPAALPFAGVVVATMLAARRFDGRALWRDCPESERA